MNEEEKRYLRLIVDHYLIYRDKTGEVILRSSIEDFEAELQKFISKVKGDVAQ